MEFYLGDLSVDDAQDLSVDEVGQERRSGRYGAYTSVVRPSSSREALENLTRLLCTSA